MLTFAMVILSPCSEAISSSTGATILHGPHHSAQKSTRTGLSLPRTSASNVASVTVLVAAPMRSPCRGSVGETYGRGASFRVLGEPALRVEGGRAPGAGGGHRLTVDVVDQVATGEDAVEVGASGR